MEFLSIVPSPPSDPAFWQRRAAEARVAAIHMRDPLCRSAMLALAARYDRLADRIVRGGNKSKLRRPQGAEPDDQENLCQAPS